MALKKPTSEQRPAWRPIAIVMGAALVLFGFLLHSALEGMGLGWGSFVPMAAEAPDKAGDAGDARSEAVVPDASSDIGSDDGESDVSNVSDATTNQNGETEESQADASSPSKTEELSNAQRLPRTWRGTMDGISREGATIAKPIEIRLTSIRESGMVSGVCAVLYDERYPDEGIGSYYIDGFVDWPSGTMELFGTGWADKGGLAYMRRFTGTLSASYDSVSGSCELLGGGRLGAWIMAAE